MYIFIIIRIEHTNKPAAANNFINKSHLSMYGMFHGYCCYISMSVCSVHVCVRVCVCMRVCIYTRMSMYIYICTSKQIHMIYAYLCVNICIYAFIYAYAYGYIYTHIYEYV